MRLRSLLIVPGDEPDRFDKAAASGADALILDLEELVAPARKSFARGVVREYLESPRTMLLFVRVNSLESEWLDDDLAAILTGKPDGLILPHADGASSVKQLIGRAGIPLPPILPVAIETPAAVLGNWPMVANGLAGLAWHVSSYEAAIRCLSSNGTSGADIALYDRARALLLFAARSAAVPAIDIGLPQDVAKDTFEAYVSAASRDGFDGMMTSHPGQIETINAIFTPSHEELAWAEAIVLAFSSAQGFDALTLEGERINRRHLATAQRMLGLKADPISQDGQTLDFNEPMGIA